MRAPDVSKPSLTSNPAIPPQSVETPGTEVGAEGGIAKVRDEALSRVWQCQSWTQTHIYLGLKDFSGRKANLLYLLEMSNRFLCTCATCFMCRHTHIQESTDCQPTVGFLIGKSSCLDALNNKVPFQMHHHNVLSTEKRSLGSSQLQDFLPTSLV